MEFILVAMFFITPPTLGQNRLWTLQSIQHIDFDSYDACKDAFVKVIGPAVQSTDTLAFTGWCVPKAFRGKEREKFLSSPEFKSEEAIKSQMEISGSCFEYVPPPVTGGKRMTPPAITAKMIGQCHQH
jgi:hypothetical protein